MKMLELPEDLTEEILCRVPATSVKQLRSTCKRWNRLFNDERIIRKHCDKSAKQLMVLMLTYSFTIIPMSIISLRGTPSVKVKPEVRLLDPDYTCEYIFQIDKVFHCDGLLLCTSTDESRALVWNPITNQSRWIRFNIRYKACNYFFLGYSQDNKSCNKSYKVLTFDRCGGTNDVTIYELNSDLYRFLDAGNNPGGPLNFSYYQIVSLKGNTYWFDIDYTKTHLGIFLNKFDFSTEKLGRRVLLPYRCQEYENLSVSVVKEEKLSMALQRRTTSETEIWVTDHIDETKAVSWSKVLVLDLSCDHPISGSFLLDEEEKVVCFLTGYCNPPQDEYKSKEMIYIVGEDSKVTELDVGVDVSVPATLNYTPSLVQIEPDGCKRKRCEYVTL